MGQPHTAETRAKISARMRERWQEQAFRERAVGNRSQPSVVYGARRHVDSWIPATPIREAIEASSVSLSAICWRLGWLRHGGSHHCDEAYGDISRLNRAIGRVPFTGPDRKGGRIQDKMLRYDTAIAIIRAIDRDPIDFGL